MQATGEAVQDFVAFAEEKTRDGSIAKTHLVIPSWRRLCKGFAGVFASSDSSNDASSEEARGGAAGNVVFVGHAWTRKKDPVRHLYLGYPKTSV